MNSKCLIKLRTSINNNFELTEAEEDAMINNMDKITENAITHELEILGLTDRELARKMIQTGDNRNKVINILKAIRK